MHNMNQFNEYEGQPIQKNHDFIQYLLIDIRWEHSQGPCYDLVSSLPLSWESTHATNYTGGRVFFFFLYWSLLWQLSNLSAP